MTPAQHQIRNAIRDLTVDGVPPSYRDIAHETGLGVGNVHRLVDILIQDGFVTQTEGRYRSLRVVGHFEPAALDRLGHADLIALRAEITRRLAA